MHSAMTALGKDIQRFYDLLEGGKWLRLLNCARAPGVQAIAVYRFGQMIATWPTAARVFVEPLFIIAQFVVRALWGIELPRSASIGPGLYIGHFGGIIVSPCAVLGSYCSLSPAITIGMSGEGPRRGVPVIGDHVYIAPGARVFGKIHIGNNVKIGANAVVYRDLPDNAIVALPGFKIVSLAGNQHEAGRDAIKHVA
jgi:serine O-acetyltransferase